MSPMHAKARESGCNRLLPLLFCSWLVWLACLLIYLFTGYLFISMLLPLHSDKPRPGTCPSLSPPSEFCPSDFDECKFDWDCETSTKKCCSNGCYRVCAEPTEGNVLGKCMACLDLVSIRLLKVKLNPG